MHRLLKFAVPRERRSFSAVLLCYNFDNRTWTDVLSRGPPVMAWQAIYRRKDANCTERCDTSGRGESKHSRFVDLEAVEKKKLGT